MEFAYCLLVCISCCAFRHLYIDKLVDKFIEESSFIIYLINIKVEERYYHKKNSECYEFYYGGKSLIEINYKLLKITFDYPSSLEVNDIIIYITFYLIYLLFS